MMVKMWIVIFWVVMLFSLVGGYQLLEEHTASILKSLP
jgi:hypothetical protein